MEITNRKPDVLVIGGGIIGAAIADALAGTGTDVLVVDRGRLGHGCSYGNAGWVTPCFATPLPRPGLFWTALRWMADPVSPLHIPPRADPLLLEWLIRFATAMRPERFRRGTAALVELSKYSLEQYADLARSTPGGLDLQARGLLVIGLTEEGVHAAHEDLALMEELGVPGRALTADAIRELEPAITGPIAGGVHFTEEAHLEPGLAVEALVSRAGAGGARFVPDTEVIDVQARGGRIHSVLTTKGWIEPREVVLAAGIWSRALASRVGLRIPLLGGKGYSMIVDHTDPPLRTPIMVVERKVAITPHATRLRLAGTLELVKDDFGVSLPRVRRIYETGAALLGLPKEYEPREVWRGLRPCTPDGLPALGRTKRASNLVVATGHQMLGVQTAPATGRLVADLVLGRTPTFDPAPFSPDRFG